MAFYDDEQFCYKTDEDQNSTWTSPFFTDEVFESLEDMMKWVKNTGYSLGYVIVTRSSKKIKSGLTNKLVLVCACSGKPGGSGSTKKTSSKKTDCPFMLVGKYSLEHRYWTIRVVCDEHNHRPTNYLEGYAYARRLSDDEFRLVEELTWKNVPPRDILLALKDQDETNLSTLSTIYEAQRKIREVARAGKTPMQVLLSILHDNGYVYQTDTHPVTNVLQALFFVHPTSYDLWRAFPHVLIIDATYKTNVYNVPFVQIVGVTSTRKTFSTAFAFISEEKEDKYEWVLEQIKLILNECMHPRVIVTDRELALMNACETVFPHANHLLCRWHIHENIVKNCRQTIRSDHDWGRFEALWKLLQDSPTWISYTENYERLQTFLSPYPRVLRYIHDNWLDKYKNHFVSASIDLSLNFGNRTTNRAESQHAKMKKYMCHTRPNLDKFIHFIDNVVNSQLTAIKESFGKSEISRYHHHNIHCFNDLRGLVSNEALSLMVEEINRLNRFRLDSSNCGCRLHNSCGLPCACRLSWYMNSGECIPLDSIDVFWRRLDLLPTTLQTDNICCKNVINHVEEHFNKQSDAGKRNILRKLVDIFNPSKTTMKPPTVKKNNRGRPSLKKHQQNKKQATKLFGVDLNVEPNIHSSYKNNKQQERKRSYSCKSFDIYPNMQPKRHGSFLNSQRGRTQRPLIPDLNEEPPNLEAIRRASLHRQIPTIFHPYISISSLQDVNPDGNCGFRSVALGLGLHEDHWPRVRSDLVRELDSRQHQYMAIFGTKGYNELYRRVSLAGVWMEMPATGLVIASKYNKVVVSLSNDGGCATCFPLWSDPPHSDSNEIIVIAHVDDNHYIRVALREGFPLPITHPLWVTYRSNIASEWSDKYVSRQNAFREYYFRESESYDLT